MYKFYLPTHNMPYVPSFASQKYPTRVTLKNIGSPQKSTYLSHESDHPHRVTCAPPLYLPPTRGRGSTEINKPGKTILTKRSLNCQFITEIDLRSSFLGKNYLPLFRHPRITKLQNNLDHVTTELITALINVCES